MIDYERSSAHLGISRQLGNVAEKVVVHERLMHSSFLKGVYEAQYYPEIKRSALSRNRHAILAMFERTKWFLGRDYKKNQLIADNIANHKCVCITDYYDQAEWLQEKTENGATFIEAEEQLEMFLASDNKPAIIQSNSPLLRKIPLETLEVHWSDIDWHGDLPAMAKELHVYPMKNWVYGLAVDLLTHHMVIDDMSDDELIEKAESISKI